MSTMLPWVHPVVPTAVPMVGVDRKQYVEAIMEAGWVPYIEAGTGLYFRHPDQQDRALWISWEWDENGRKEWYTETVKA